MKKLLMVALILNVSLMVLAVRLLQELEIAHGGTLQGPTKNGDMNNSGVVDIADASYLLNFLFLGGPEPVAIAQGNTCEECDDRFVNEGQPDSLTSEMILDGAITEDDLAFAVAGAQHTHTEFTELNNQGARIDALEQAVAMLSEQVNILSLPLGSSQERPGADAMQILEAADSRGDGLYWIDPNLRGLSTAS